MTAVLILMTLGLSSTTVISRLNVLDFELKRVSQHLADGCVDAAILKIINNSSYSPSSEQVNLGTNTCTIISVTTSGSNKVIRTQAKYPATGSNSSYSNVEATVLVGASSVSVLKWAEVSSF